MIRPLKMKSIELTVLRRDIDLVLEYLGMRGVFQLASPASSVEGAKNESAEKKDPVSLLARIREAASYLRVDLPEEPGEGSRLPAAEDAEAVTAVADGAEELKRRETEAALELKKLSAALEEAHAFSNLNAPFSDLDALSYLTLRVGRMDPRRVAGLTEALGDRAAVIPLGEDGRVLAAASRKGRFALDTELAKVSFTPIAVPEGFTGVPRELLAGLEKRIAEVEEHAAVLAARKSEFSASRGAALVRLSQSYQIAVAVDRLKAGLESTRSAFRLRGWIAAEKVAETVADLERLAGGRVAVVSYDPSELESVREGHEKVPVSLSHGKFVAGFEPLIFSYGAPLYGTVDPTPFVAFSFTLLFGLMFGDVGQGAVLLLLGILVDRRRVALLSSFSRFSPALIAVGLSSMAMGLLNGEVFTLDALLIAPTRAVTGFITGTPMDRILQLMPEKGSLGKLFLFFGFTIAVGVVVNSVGLVINIANQLVLGRWERAVFSKTGVCGAVFFWYALFLGVRVALGGSLAWFDAIGIGAPLALLVFGPALARLAGGKRPVLEHGFVAFAVEGVVELIESASYYISNTVSFLRVGAFALSHAVLSFIVFALSEMVGRAPVGVLFSVLVVVVGNLIIISLEGLIVAIQVVRLQYYEFFSKFFTETGAPFAPFRFRREVK